MTQDKEMEQVFKDFVDVWSKLNDKYKQKIYDANIYLSSLEDAKGMVSMLKLALAFQVLEEDLEGGK